MAVTEEQLSFLKRHLVDENPTADKRSYYVGSRALSARQIYDILEQRRTDDPHYGDLSRDFGATAQRFIDREKAPWFVKAFRYLSERVSPSSRQ